ncbi:MAG: GldG family protein [Gammaproteobacteria bacterium]|nr:GldG family protein [Gammaproteobacteria bacterium]
MVAQRVLRSWAGVLALVALASLAIGVSQRHGKVFDVTAGGRNSLSAASTAVIKQLTDTVQVTAYLPEDSAARALLVRLIDTYRRAGAVLDLAFIDPAALPEDAGTTGHETGDVIIRYQGRQQQARALRVNALNEAGLTNALAALQRSGERWLAFVSGHGERSPVAEGNHDISHWANQLAARGMSVRELALADVGAIPDNTTVVVIASPRVDYLPAEVRALIQYLAGGGNLLWLLEPDGLAGLNALAESLGVAQLPGTVIDPSTVRYNIDNAAITTVADYAASPPLEGFRLLTVFPYASALAVLADDGFSATTLMQSDARAWSETGRIDGNVALDAGIDIPGPHKLAIALERAMSQQSTQRVVVIGDGDFLANQYIGNGGNMDLGLRLMEWLAMDDGLIDIPAPRALDSELGFTRLQIAIFGFGFLIVLPGLLLINGFLIARRRNRA